MTAVFAAASAVQSSDNWAESDLAGAVPMGTTPRKALWTGRVLSGLVVLLLAFDASMKLLQVAPAIAGTAELGYSPSVIFPLGVVQLVCLIAYVVRQTSVLGAILWTGYLGGAIATHVRVGNPLFSHILFPVYVAILLWGSLWLRNPRVRALIPFKTP